MLRTFFLSMAAFSFLFVGAVNYVNAYVYLSEGNYGLALLLGFGFYALWDFASRLFEKAGHDTR